MKKLLKYYKKKNMKEKKKDNMIMMTMVKNIKIIVEIEMNMMTKKKMNLTEEMDIQVILS